MNLETAIVRRSARARLAAALGILLSCALARADALQDRFVKPPDDARPWVYWYWMNGNVSREGIRADLQAMRDAGIGGAMLFDIGLHPPGPVKVRSPEWFDLVRFAVQEAAARGIRISFHCPGWETSGGPWITPELAMQELTWSETVVEGPRELALILPQPPTRLACYRDALVVAFPAPEHDESLLTRANPRFLDPGGKPLPDAETAKLSGTNLDNAASVPAELNIVFEQPVRAASLSVRILDRLHSAIRPQVRPAHTGGGDANDRIRWFFDLRRLALLEAHIARTIEDCAFHNSFQFDFANFIGGTMPHNGESFSRDAAIPVAILRETARTDFNAKPQSRQRPQRTQNFQPLMNTASR